MVVNDWECKCKVVTFFWASSMEELGTVEEDNGVYEGNSNAICLYEGNKMTIHYIIIVVIIKPFWCYNLYYFLL